MAQAWETVCGHTQIIDAASTAPLHTPWCVHQPNQPAPTQARHTPQQHTWSRAAAFLLSSNMDQQSMAELVSWPASRNVLTS